MDPDSHVWTVETGATAIGTFATRRVQEFNPKGEFIRKWGSSGTAAGQFSGLQGLAIDSAGHIWTVEGGGSKGNNRVQEFSSEGTFITQFGKEGSEAGQFKSPEAIALDAAGNVWVADTENNRVEEFKPSGEFIRKWGTAGSEAGNLSAPRGLAFDSDGNLWVADSANDRLQRFSPEGAYLTGFGTPGNNAGEFAEPRGLAIDAKGKLWVADTANNRVQEFAWPLNTTTYAYDQAGDLTGVHRPAAGSLPAIDQTLAYDATGLIASKTAGSTTRYLAWDASTALPLLLNDGENSYIYGPGGLPVEQINAKGEPTYLHHDQLGSTRLLTGTGGTATASFAYTPYGALEAKTGTAATSLGFAAQYTDSETGLQYLRARFYDPSTGQFMSRDPLAAITREPFDYAANNPLRFKDPSGLDFAEELGGVGLPCLFCEVSRASQELLEPPFEEAENAANWVLNHLGTEELDEGEFENPEPCLELPVDPWELEKEIGVPDQEMGIARKEVDIGRMGTETNPKAPGPGGSPKAKAVKVAALLAMLYEALHHH